jgi:hypothetical protein
LHGTGERPKPFTISPLTPKALGIELDAELEEQIERLYSLELENLHDGVDVREKAYAIARRPELRLRLEQSDELVDTLAGHTRFRRKRRHGILRHLANEPDLAGLPLFLPPFPIMPKGPEWRGVELDLHLGRLTDELESIWMVVRYTDFGWAPTAKILNSVQMRAFLAITASNFFELNRQWLIPGRLGKATRYDSETVARWLLSQAYRLHVRRKK